MLDDGMTYHDGSTQGSHTSVSELAKSSNDEREGRFFDEAHSNERPQ